MQNSLFGLILGVAVITFAVFFGVKNPGVFINVHALIIVLGGTFAAALICFPVSHLGEILRVFFLASWFDKKNTAALKAVQQIIRLSELIHQGHSIAEEIPKVENPFLKESLELIDGGGLSDSESDEVLFKRIHLQNERYRRDSLTLKTLGKFPPAFGLVGTTVGMITLLQGIGEPNAFEQLGPSMALSLVATFYGLIFSNVILVPFGESLLQASEDNLLVRRIVVDGVRLIRDGKHPFLIEEYLKSYLPPALRAEVRQVAQS